MNTTLKEFPFNNRGKAASFPKSDLKTALEWKEQFEAEAREILANLEKEKRELKRQKLFAESNRNPAEISAYEELIAHDEGRIFSLKQLLGDLPKSQTNNSKQTESETDST